MNLSLFVQNLCADQVIHSTYRGGQESSSFRSKEKRGGLGFPRPYTAEKTLSTAMRTRSMTLETISDTIQRDHPSPKGCSYAACSYCWLNHQSCLAPSSSSKVWLVKIMAGASSQGCHGDLHLQCSHIVQDAVDIVQYCLKYAVLVFYVTEMFQKF